MSLKVKINNNLKNVIGKSFKKKYVVIESDDWGSIRMPSRQSFEILQKEGLNLGQGEGKRYNLTDTLADAEDFEALFYTLLQHRDCKGNHPIFTAVSVVANPDFEKIKQDRYQVYHYEPFTQTLKRYHREDALAWWKEGINQKLFIPEFHGREHLNAMVWLRRLQQGDKATISAFDQGCWGFVLELPYGLNYQAAFNVEFPEDIDFQRDAVKEGLRLFERIHGYKASFFVPPNGFINNELEPIAKSEGVSFMGTSKIQHEPHGQGKIKKRFHWLGQRNKHGQIYLTRNAFFEPNAPGRDWVDSCLKEIHYAFKWKKPAVISSHRTNYIGNLNLENRKKGLEQLNALLKSILKKWPEVRFITSTQLGQKLADGQYK